MSVSVSDSSDVWRSTLLRDTLEAVKDLLAQELGALARSSEEKSAGWEARFGGLKGELERVASELHLTASQLHQAQQQPKAGEKSEDEKVQQERARIAAAEAVRSQVTKLSSQVLGLSEQVAVIRTWGERLTSQETRSTEAERKVTEWREQTETQRARLHTAIGEVLGRVEDSEAAVQEWGDSLENRVVEHVDQRMGDWDEQLETRAKEIDLLGSQLREEHQHLLATTNAHGVGLRDTREALATNEAKMISATATLREEILLRFADQDKQIKTLESKNSLLKKTVEEQSQQMGVLRQLIDCLKTDFEEKLERVNEKNRELEGELSRSSSSNMKAIESAIQSVETNLSTVANAVEALKSARPPSHARQPSDSSLDDGKGPAAAGRLAHAQAARAVAEMEELRRISGLTVSPTKPAPAPAATATAAASTPLPSPTLIPPPAAGAGDSSAANGTAAVAADAVSSSSAASDSAPNRAVSVAWKINFPSAPAGPVSSR